MGNTLKQQNTQSVQFRTLPYTFRTLSVQSLTPSVQSLTPSVHVRTKIGGPGVRPVRDLTRGNRDLSEVSGRTVRSILHLYEVSGVVN